MRNIFYILTIVPFLTFGQTVPQSIIGTYSYSDGNFFYKLELKKDSTFAYQNSFHRGSTASTGKWKFSKDTLFLMDYEKPLTIKNVEEVMLDTLGNNSVIEVIINDTDAIHIRGDHNIYIDGQPTKVKYDSKTKRHVVTDFEIWVNNECSNPQLTDKLGRTKFTNKMINTISFDYDKYLIKDPMNNYFILTLSNYPIFVSPPTLAWTKWVLEGDKLSPIDCNKRLDYIKLKR
ncbi:MAG: hypothetical protein JNL69_01005 [Bacteroidia bacterium]|nr:hypothetical protein [Bacteroidia bacterium]